MNVQPATQEATEPGLVAAVTALSDGATNRVRSLLAAYLVVGSAARIAGKWRTRLRDEVAYTLTVAGDDDLYPDVHRWLLDQLPAKQRRSMSVRSRRHNELIEHKPSGTSTPLRYLYDGTRAQTVTLEGHRVRVEVERPNYSTKPGEDENPGGAWADRFRIKFTVHSVAARDALIRMLQRIADDRIQQAPKVLIAARWGGWVRRDGTAARPLQSVVLRDGQVEQIIDDLQRFLGGEGDYLRLGVPWHRGFLFEGKPGTGKTSIARALASHFRLDLYYIPLPAVQNDSVLLELFSAIEPRSMLLLEDIDVVHGAKTRDDNNPGVSLAGLLNALDGVVTPHGMVTVMTTNDASVLDPALIRPGRVDVREEFGLLDDRQLARLGAVMTGREVDLPPLSRPVSPASAVEVIKQNLHDPEAAVAALKRFAASTGGDR